MAKTIQVNLQFNANVKEAQRQMQQLQQQLSQLATSQPTTSFSLTPQLKEAQQSAMDLKIALNNAMNVDTGRLNLNKFQSELNRSGKSIQQYAQSLQALGPAGVRTFQQVAQAVAQADTKLFNLSGGAKKLMDTLGNTARWQLASSAIQGVTSAIGDTIEYAKELDTSLNNIRIVTGKSADQMAAFAKEANKMAKELSTTTTKYSDASLIYYQQGLNEKEVKERTEATIKLANVTGENAQQVSEWMTAIWNNFDDGSEKLEYYADVMAKLGAATASSADEIATGLEKFAAVAETVGLSYEYATSALATVTAETRQSADVVGTAFKTLFARMEGLKLGETLDDGTTLNQYSLALQKVGIDNKDANGELKNMDTILDQTGARWESLNKDQQIALAQQVAGIRQYNQFMALMENWDVMQENLKITEKANGALTEQNRIYEESMTASQDRMKAAGEELKALIIGGDDLIPLYNFAGGALEVITELLEAFGGLPTIILGVATALTKLYQPQIASFFSQAAVGLSNFKSASSNLIHGKGFKSDNSYQRNVVELGSKMAMDTLPEGAKASQYAKENAAIEQKLIGLGNSVNENVKQRLDWTFELIKKQEEYLLLLEKEIELQGKAVGEKQDELQNQGVSLKTADSLTSQATSLGQMKGYGELATKKIENITNLGPLNQESRQSFVDDTKKSLSQMTKSATSGIDGMSGVGLNLDDITFKVDDEMISASEATKQAEEALDRYAKNGTEDLNQILKLIQQINSALSEVGTDAVKANAETVMEIPTFGEMGKKYEDPSKSISVKQIEKDLNDIDGRSKLKEVKSSKKDGTAINKKTLKEQVNNIKKLQKEQSKYNKSSDEYKKLQKEIDKGTKKLNSDMKKFLKTQDQNQKVSKKQIKNNEEVSKTIDELIGGAENHGKVLAGQSDAVSALDDEINKFNDDLNNGGTSFTHWSDTLASGLAGVSSYMMGLNMLTSSFDNLFSAIGRGDATWQDWISSISSAMMSLTTLIPTISQTVTWVGNLVKSKQQQKIAEQALTAATAAGVAQDEAALIIDKLQHGASEQEIKDEYGEAGAKVINALAENSKNAGQGPVGWAKFAAGLAMIAPIALMVGVSAIGGAKSGGKEAKQEEVSKGTENLEAINENQELASSVNELTDEYKALQEAGESTADVLENMKDKIPELIDNYNELAKTLGMGLDTTKLEEAYEHFLKTGDISKYEAAQKQLDEDIMIAERATAVTTANAARDLVMDAARADDGKKSGKNFQVEIGDKDNSSVVKGDDSKVGDDYFAKHFGDEYWNSDTHLLKFDMTSNASILEAYDKMISVRDQMQKDFTSEQLAELDHYRELNREIGEMAENIEDLRLAQDSIYQADKEQMLEEDYDQTLLDKYRVDDVSDYEAQRKKIINYLKEEKDWTEAQATAYLKATDAFGAYEETVNTFSEDGFANIQNMSQKTLTDLKDWYANLPEDERTLAIGLDYTLIGSVEDANKALQEKIKEAEKAAILEQVTKLEVDETVFDTYVDGIAEINGGLDTTSNLTKQVALNNLILSKGLEALVKSWDKTSSVIQKGNKATLEYAEAIGETKTALEEMFGVQPSTEYIEQHFNKINDLINGDLSSLQELQDALAEDYIVNMEYSTAINDSWQGSISDAQETLNNLINDLDTSIEIGKESTLSSDFLDSVQDMLDAGVIAEEQLENLFRAKGYELNITDWKEIDGPEKTITQKTYVGGKKVSTKTIKESEKIKVPVINGDDSGINGGSAPTYTKSTDARVIDTTSIEERADETADTIKDLKKEEDRYHEINEIIADTEQSLDALAEAKDRAFGADKLALMDKEIQKRKELLAQNKQLLKDTQDYYDKDRQEILKYNVDLDKQGRIANYEWLDRQYRNKLIENANNEEAFDKINKEYENFKDAASQYEETLNQVEEQQIEVINQQNEIADLALEKIELKTSIKVELAEDEIAYIDFLMTKIEDDAFAAAEAIGLWGQKAEATIEQFEATEQGIKEVMDAVNTQGYITEEQANYLRENRQALMDYATELEEIRASVGEKLTEAYEAWNEEIDKGIEKINHQASMLEHLKNIVDIIGKDALGISDETMKKMADTDVEVANAAVESAKAKLDANKATLEEYERNREYAISRGDDKDVEYWDEQIELVNEKIAEGEEELNDSLENALDKAVERFKTSVNIVVETFSEAVSGIYDNIEDMRSEWDHMGEVNDRFLKDYEKTYEISKLMRNIDNSIDATDNVKNKKELNNLQKEIQNMTKDGQKLSKYDLEYLQKKYDLLLAEQALKDKQNAKSTVRLKRDSEGNFGYVYTADAAEIDKAQQQYEDKVYAYQEFVNKMDTELTEFFISTQEKMQEEIQAAADIYGRGSERFLQEVEKIEARYAEDMGYITGEYEKMTTRNIEINSQFNTGVADSYNETFLGRIHPDYDSFEQLYEETTEDASDACEALGSAVSELQRTFDYQLELAGKDATDFGSTVNEELDTIAEKTTNAKNKTKELTDLMQTEMPKAAAKVTEFQLTYSSNMSTIWGKTNNVQKKVQELLNKFGELKTAASEDYTPKDNSATGNSNGNSVLDDNNSKDKDETEIPDADLSAPHTIKGFGTYGGGYAAVQLDNGKWYGARSFGVSSVSHSIGDSVTLRPNTTLKNYTEVTPDQFKVEEISSGSKYGQHYKLSNGQWYTSDALQMTYQHFKGNIVVGDSAIPIKDTGTSKPFETIKFSPPDAIYVARYDKNGNFDYNHQYFKNDEIEITAVSKDLKDGKRLYKIHDLKNGYINQTGLNTLMGNKDTSKQLYKDYNLKQFDTGGYTGAWGPEGRLAMLHQKEIVLNAHDTENLLTAVSMIREISDKLESNALAMRYLSAIGNYNAAINTNNHDTLQQEVTIHAEFPNATNHSEIEEAFGNLVNLASQYANRK